MFCSQCTAELPATATTCSQCGLSISQGQQTTFSYLPSGIPSWPRSVSEKIPYLVESQASEPFMSVAQPKVKTKTRASALARRIISIVLILLITPALGILATLGVLTMQGRFSPSLVSLSSLSHLPSASNTANPFEFNGAANTLLPPTAFSSARDTSMKIAVQYPSDWTAGPADQSTDPIQFPITQPGQKIRILIARFSSSSSLQIPGPDQFNTQLVRFMSQSFTKVMAVNPLMLHRLLAMISGWSRMLPIPIRTMLGITLPLLRSCMIARITTISISAYPKRPTLQAMRVYIQPILSSFKFIA